MSKIRVSREFSFEAAHALRRYDGPCKNIHGHSYKLFVTLIGPTVDDTTSPKNGMVIDFKDLKLIVMREIIALFDHSLLVSDEVDKSKLEALDEMFGNILQLNYQPSCENIVADIANRLMPHIPKGIELYSLKLHETANSYAEWFAEDN